MGWNFGHAGSPSFDMISQTGPSERCTPGSCDDSIMAATRQTGKTAKGMRPSGRATGDGPLRFLACRHNFPLFCLTRSRTSCQAIRWAGAHPSKICSKIDRRTSARHFMRTRFGMIARAGPGDPVADRTQIKLHFSCPQDVTKPRAWLPSDGGRLACARPARSSSEARD